MEISFRIFILFIVLIVFSSVVSAVPPGDVMKFGNVTIEGNLHADKGIECNSCHDGIFQKKKGAVKITMNAIFQGKFCGACHNGKRAFNPKEMSNCGKCHQM